MNDIIDDVNCLSSPQLNTAIATVVYKGKQKSLYNNKSFRLVRILPLLCRIFDEYVRPNFIKITKPLHNPNQYGFTAGINYLMAALQRHEAEKFCLDNKKTFFSVTLDGQSAFDVVSRPIQTRELYCSANQSGSYWSASTAEYNNTITKIKMNGKLSADISENQGVKQGGCNSSDHYKIYIAPLLETVESANLGVWIGPINTGLTCCADDFLGMSDNPHNLQCILDIASHYGKMYKVTYGSDKTKVVISGPSTDQQYYKDTKPWKMNDEKIQVVDQNEHLGQVISGDRQESRNVDLRINKGRKALFSLLGPAFAYKCLLSPEVKLHLLRTFINPVLRSGLSTFALRPNDLQPLMIFQRKTIKSILHLSVSAATPAIYFLTSELPIEAQIHQDIFSLFYSIWSNPNRKIFQIIKYLLNNSRTNSGTWTAHIRQLSNMYQLDDPLDLLQKDPPSKSVFKEYISTKITAFHESELREMAKCNSVMKYFNVSLFGLRGKQHPAIKNIINTNQVSNMRPHLKMLVGDYLSYEKKSKQSGGSPVCRICESGESESYSHILCSCRALSEPRERIIPEMLALCERNALNTEYLVNDCEVLTQFILDPSSMNLLQRVNIGDPVLDQLFMLSRDLCNALHKLRMKKIQEKSKHP